MTPPTVVLFDLDGTLTDPRVGITVSMQHALATVGVEVADPDELTWCIGPPIIENLARLDVTGDRAWAAVAAYRERYDEVGALENVVYDGIPGLLDALRADGRRLSLATSKPEPVAERILVHFDLARRFDVLAGGTLDQTRSAKADVVAWALDQLGRLDSGGPDPADVVLVGDRRHDVEGARAHGIGVVAVTWGYAEPGELELAGPDAVVTTVDELATTLGLG